MAYNNGYVKFIRGTISAYNKLSSKDPNTLYFITDSTLPEGANLNLYLGNQLICSTDETINFTDLKDVLLDENIKTDSILVYDLNKKQWINKALSDFINLLDISEMEGATSSEDGRGGLVPVPKVGQDEFFLQGSGNWVDISQKIEQVSTPIIIKTVGNLIDGADQAFDTLKEISDWILNDGTEAVNLINEFNEFKTKVGDLSDLIEEQTLSGKVNNLETSVGVLEELLKDNEGNFIDLNSYVTKTLLEATVGSLSDLETNEKISLVGAINELHDQLTWGDIIIKS